MKLKALFINHDIGPYGAAKSLRCLLQNYHDTEIDLLFHKPLLFSKSSNQIKEYFGKHIQNIYPAILPFDPCFEGKPNELLPIMYRNLFLHFSRPIIARIIQNGAYDFIHLNSLTLHPLIEETRRYIIHVREIFDHTNSSVIHNLQKCAGVIFIDEATRSRFPSEKLRNTIILNNPVDMTPLANSVNLLQAKISVPELQNKTIFSVIANHSKIKGTDFIISCFKEFHSDQCRLLIVGGGDKEYLKICQKLAEPDKRIIFIGEQPDATAFYLPTDFIVRGEPFPCVGRTIGEGLYSGCGVIIPTQTDSNTKVENQEFFKDKIHFYKARDKSDLLRKFDLLKSIKILDRKFMSDVPEYVHKFHEFVLRCIN